MRDENQLHIQHHFRCDFLSYAGKVDFAGRRVLGFGSGSGASSMVARMSPEAKILGLELGMNEKSVNPLPISMYEVGETELRR